jgi:hypothetical protein
LPVDGARLEKLVREVFGIDPEPLDDGIKALTKEDNDG